jgi:hypothetical protein
MRWARNVAVWGRGNVHTTFWINMKARGHLSVDGRTILKCILKKWDGRVVDWINLAQN